MHQIIETKNGKKTIKMVDTLKKCNDRIKALRSSKNGAVYTIEPTTETQKVDHRTNTANYNAGCYAKTPKKVK